MIPRNDQASCDGLHSHTVCGTGVERLVSRHGQPREAGMRAINSPGRAGPASTDLEAPSSRNAISPHPRLTCESGRLVIMVVQQRRQIATRAVCVQVDAVLAGALRRLIGRGLTCCDRRCRAQSTSGCVAHHVGNRSHVCTGTVHVPVAPRRCHKERTVASCDAARCDAMGCDEKRSEAPSLWALASPPSKVARSQINFGGSRLHQVLLPPSPFSAGPGHVPPAGADMVLCSYSAAHG